MTSRALSINEIGFNPELQPTNALLACSSVYNEHPIAKFSALLRASHDAHSKRYFARFHHRSDPQKSALRLRRWGAAAGGVLLAVGGFLG